MIIDRGWLTYGVQNRRKRGAEVRRPWNAWPGSASGRGALTSMYCIMYACSVVWCVTHAHVQCSVLCHLRALNGTRHFAELANRNKTRLELNLAIIHTVAVADNAFDGYDAAKS